MSTMAINDDPPRRRVPLAAYANYFEVGHNAFEFLIDFGQFQPDAGEVTLHSRMATGPVHAKLLAQLLADAIARFEAENGEIVDLAQPDLNPLITPPPDFERRAVAVRDARAALRTSDSTKR